MDIQLGFSLVRDYFRDKKRTSTASGKLAKLGGVSLGW